MVSSFGCIYRFSFWNYYYHSWIIYQTSNRNIRMHFDCFNIISYHIISSMLNVEGGWANANFCPYSLSTIDHHTIWNVRMFNVRCTKSIYSNVGISEMWKHHLQFHFSLMRSVFSSSFANFIRIRIRIAHNDIVGILTLNIIIICSHHFHLSFFFFRFVAHHHRCNGSNRDGDEVWIFARN